MFFRKFFRYVVSVFLLLSLLLSSGAEHPRYDTIRDRIENWSYPSALMAWHSERIVNLRDDFTAEEISGKLNLQYVRRVWWTKLEWDEDANTLRWSLKDPVLELNSQFQIRAINPNFIDLAG